VDLIIRDGPWGVLERGKIKRNPLVCSQAGGVHVGRRKPQLLVSLHEKNPLRSKFGNLPGTSFNTYLSSDLVLGGKSVRRLMFLMRVKRGRRLPAASEVRWW